MKKEYYIQGDHARANEIKAAFERLGYDTRNLDYSCGLFITFNNDRYVHFLYPDSQFVDIIKSHPGYTELPLSVEHNFKVGDWVVKKDGKTFYGGNYAEQITLIEVDEKGKRIWLSSTTYVHDDDIRLWSIADAEDGDVLSVDFNGFQKIVIFKSLSDKGVEGYGITAFKDRVDFPTSYGEEYYSKTWTKTLTPATKEQRSRLFTELEKAGYKWDAEKKELRKIQHYDIANFHEGMPVLVRDDNSDEWNYLLFSHYRKKFSDHFFAGGNPWCQCVPFSEDTKHLLGTTDPCDERYINW
jgi:hypothetical protein